MCPANSGSVTLRETSERLSGRIIGNTFPITLSWLCHIRHLTIKAGQINPWIEGKAGIPSTLIVPLSLTPSFSPPPLSLAPSSLLTPLPPSLSLLPPHFPALHSQPSNSPLTPPSLGLLSLHPPPLHYPASSQRARPTHSPPSSQPSGGVGK